MKATTGVGVRGIGRKMDSTIGLCDELRNERWGKQRKERGSGGKDGTEEKVGVKTVGTREG